MTSMKQLGVLDYVDAVSVHAYVAGAPEQTAWQFAAIKDIVGDGVALVSGEWGWATCSDASGAPANCVGGTMPDVVSQADQAMYVARQWLGNALARVPLSIYYEWMNDDDDDAQCESNWGLNNANNGAPKPAYHAALTVQNLVGTRPVKEPRIRNKKKICERGRPPTFRLFHRTYDAHPVGGAVGVRAGKRTKAN